MTLRASSREPGDAGSIDVDLTVLCHRPILLLDCISNRDYLDGRKRAGDARGDISQRCTEAELKNAFPQGTTIS